MDIGDHEKASLETVCILFLPALTSKACVQWAGCTEEHPGHALFSKNHQHGLPPHSHPPLTTSSDSSTEQLEGKVSARHRRLYSVSRDGIIHVVMQVNVLAGYHRMTDLIVRCRTLLEFTDVQAQAGPADVEGLGVRTTRMLPWETWGPTNSRILDHGSFTWGGLAGERYATALQSRITMRDFNPYRMRRALALFGVAGKEVTLACGSRVKVINETSVYRGGECFCNDIETSLPYVETVTSYNGCQDISMDENYLVVEVRTAVSRVHSTFGY